ncbi:hypothetical protein [Sphingomonas abaci]|uniref:Uncharacterized protein n=1 Tax=Sphingomonas abaci TaxID=237611 RepID=A0A7W7EWZ1_9SPHN|nr:hypothetical protein [Sphingomonas abaci]MBB4617042.1 hypothetical protein [Sphingomonas abaci]
MFSLILAAAVAAAAPAPAAALAEPMPDIANARMSAPVLPASKWAQPRDREMVVNALRKPVSQQMTGAKGPYYCFIDDISKKGETRRVCRKRADWNRLGLEPVL